MKNSCTLSLSTSLGTSESSISASSSSDWQNKSVSKYYINTNGTKAIYEQFNFSCAPDEDLYGYSVSLTTTSSCKLEGDSKNYTIDSGC